MRAGNTGSRKFSLLSSTSWLGGNLRCFNDYVDFSFKLYSNLQKGTHVWFLEGSLAGIIISSKMKTRVLRLYKDLLRYGQNLQFTDKKYFKYRIKKSFLENQSLDDVKAIEFCIQKGQKALDTRRVV